MRNSDYGTAPYGENENEPAVISGGDISRSGMKFSTKALVVVACFVVMYFVVKVIFG